MRQIVGDIIDSNAHHINIFDRSRHKESKLQAKLIAHKHISIGLVLANILILIINIYFVCHFYPRVPSYLGFDYIGVIVGILSLLVAILITWQIYNYSTLIQRVDELENIKISIKSNMITLYTTNNELSLSTQKCIQNYIDAIEYAIEANDYDSIELPVVRLKNMCNQSDIFQIYKGERKRYIKILRNIEDVDDIISAINTAKEL